MMLVVVNNLTDYGANLVFVRHVLAMDTVFPGGPRDWRAITGDPAQHGFYAVIILWEALAAGLLGAGAWRMLRCRRADGAAWERAKALAEVGLVTGLFLWLVAFLAVGGEWFLMWQSATWNGQPAAFRMFAVTGLVLLYLTRSDRPPPGGMEPTLTRGGRGSA
jgi:predicted small integral membrane protein